MQNISFCASASHISREFKSWFSNTGNENYFGLAQIEVII